MKKIIIVLLALIMVLSFVPHVQSLDSDTFTVTMSGAYLECNIVNATWAIGIVTMDTSYWTNETGKTQLADTWNCTAGTNIDYEMTISTDADTWKTVWAENWTTAANAYKLNASSDSWVGQEALNLTVYSDVKANFDPQTNASFDLRFDSPQSTTTGVTQTITLTGKVTVH